MHTASVTNLEADHLHCVRCVAVWFNQLHSPQESVPLVAETLAMLLKFVLLVALTILSFGYAYSALALDLYGVSSSS